MNASRIAPILATQAVRITGKKNEILISKGDPVSGVFLVVEGALRIFAMNSEGKQATLYRLHADELCLLSLNSTFRGGNYPAWVKVESESATVLVAPGGVFKKLYASEPNIQEVLLEALTTSFSDLLLQLDELLLSSLGERVMSFLLNNQDAEGDVRMTHQDLAEHLGVTREAVSREISQLRDAGLVQSGRGVVRVLSGAGNS